MGIKTAQVHIILVLNSNTLNFTTDLDYGKSIWSQE